MESEERYRLIFNASRDPILILTAGHSMKEPLGILEANDRAIQLLGYSREELMRMSLKDILNAVSVDHAMEAMRDSLATGEGQFEIILVNKDGNGVQVEVISQQIEFQGKKVTLCVLRDISELQRTESALRKAETRLKTISENMLDLIAEVDMNGMYAYASPSHKAVLGYEPFELIGKSIFDFLYPVDADRLKAIVIDSVGKPEFGKLEIRLRHSHGYFIWLETIGKLRLDDGGHPIGAVLSSREITDRKKFEADLKTEHDFSSAIVDAAQAMVIVLDTKGKILRFNRACENILGYSMDEAIGRTVFDLFSGPLMKVDIEKEKKIFDELMTGSYPITYESQWLKKDGSPLRISWSATALTDDHQQIQNVIITGMDITAKWVAEEDRRGRAKLDGLLSRVSKAAVVVDNLNRFLDNTLKDLGETMGVSRTFMIEFNVQMKTMTQAREWVAPECPTDSHLWQNVPVATIPADYDMIMREEIGVFKDVERDHYDPLLREMLLKENIKALLSVPVTLGNEPYGLIGFDVIGHTREWRNEDVDIAIAIARIVGYVIEREKKKEMLEIKDSAIEMATNAIAFADPTGKIIYVNNVFWKNTKFKSKDEVLGKSFSEFFANPGDVQRIIADLKRDGGIITEVDAKRADGSIVRVELTGTVLKDEKGEIKMFVGSTIDVSKRKKMV